MTDGHVTLDGEGGDREDGGVRWRLGGQGAEHTESLAEQPRVGGPERIGLQWKTENQL